jgi:hypothetical protein
MNIQIHEFNSIEKEKNYSAVIIGYGGNKKSNIVNQLYHDNNKNNEIYIFSQDVINYKNFNNVFNEYKQEIVNNIFDEQYKNPNRKNIFIVLDDFIKLKISMKDPEISRLLYENKHYDITVIFIMENPEVLSPEIRINFDYVFLLHGNFTDKKETLKFMQRLYYNYGQIISEYDKFLQIFIQITSSNIMVINQRNKNVYFLCFDSKYILQK